MQIFSQILQIAPGRGEWTETDVQRLRSVLSNYESFHAAVIITEKQVLDYNDLLRVWVCLMFFFVSFFLIGPLNGTKCFLLFFLLLFLEFLSLLVNFLCLVEFFGDILFLLISR